MDFLISGELNFQCLMLILKRMFLHFQGTQNNLFQKE